MFKCSSWSYKVVEFCPTFRNLIYKPTQLWTRFFMKKNEITYKKYIRYKKNIYRTQNVNKFDIYYKQLNRRSHEIGKRIQQFIQRSYSIFWPKKTTQFWRKQWLCLLWKKQEKDWESLLLLWKSQLVSIIDGFSIKFVNTLFSLLNIHLRFYS